MPLRSKIFAILSGLWATFIFSNSLKNGVNSEKMSNPIANAISNFFNNIGINWNEESVAFFIRKAAHFTEFMLLGILVSLIFVFINRKFSYSFGTILFIITIIPVCDEFIQTFVVGRSGQVSDVVLDFCGAFVGFISVVALKKITNKKSDYSKRMHG
ncbi:MAG: VanZ family protein [Oscillospiraceae bacterium]